MKILITPENAFAPYSAEPGPLIISILLIDSIGISSSIENPPKTSLYGTPSISTPLSKLFYNFKSTIVRAFLNFLKNNKSTVLWYFIK